MKNLMVFALLNLTLFSCVSNGESIFLEKISDDNYWRVIATSSEIFQVKTSELIVDDIKINSYYEYNISVENVFKGTNRNTVQFKIFMKEENYNFILSLQNNEEVVIFIISTYDGYGHNNYLANYFIEKSIIIYTEEIEKNIKEEILLQNSIIENKLYADFIIDKNINNKVKRYINRTGNILFQNNSFEELEKIDMDGVPYIILFMDDFRKLPIQSIILNNKIENAFERNRHYGPALVIDALAAILNQITGESFGFIYNGESSQDERINCLNAWRIYLFKLNKKQKRRLTNIYNTPKFA